ncbi:MAG: sialate O-acetylesterase, partial [Planctomycetaceae bacterium]|nr:sialate O-acetylesterase [Planctomycetaceae bacterium]
VTVSINGQTQKAVAAENGKWSLKLDAMPAGGPYEMTVSGKNTIKFENVMLGDVWVCSGQSNMQMSVQSSYNSAEEIKNADYPNIRLITVPMKSTAVPQDNFDGKWVACSPETIPNFSAVAYFFGRTLHNEHQNKPVAIGLIHTSWGGSSCETWISEGVVAQYKDYEQIMQRRAAHLEKNPQGGDNQQAGYLFNAMINPLLPYGIKGAIWYQGETNAGRAYQYRTLFPLMIQTWREAWGQGDFPFYFVQLANYDPNGDKVLGESAWAELREAQTMTLGLRNTGMAVTIDIGDSKDIHPKNKQEVGRRLALWSLARDYEQSITIRKALGDVLYLENVSARPIHFSHYTGPMFRSMTIRDGKAILSFGFAYGLKTNDSGPVTGFIIAGADRKFVKANAVIEGSTVIVSSPEVPNPVAVRYAWANDPTCNLCNDANLPACPFRTDMWPGVTINNK